MDNATAMNKLLSMNCHNDTCVDGVWGFLFTLHCTSVYITAKKTKLYDSTLGYAEYEVLSFEEVESEDEE
jgi:hypothetical protein